MARLPSIAMIRIFLVCFEDGEDGWQMIGQADMFANLPGDGVLEKVRDRQGREWDVRVPSAFRFQYVRHEGAKHDGILLKMCKIYGDTAPVLGKMTQRRLLKKEDFGF